MLAALLVKDAVGVVVLLPIGGKKQYEKDDEAAHDRQCVRQIGPAGEVLDKAGHDQEQKAHAGHGDEIGECGPEYAALYAGDTFVGQEILLLE